MTLSLPIPPRDALRSIIDPALERLPPSLATDPARVLLLAMALQESLLAYRVQIGGPAHGLWQMERDGGVRGVLTHPATADLAAALCAAHGIAATDADVYAALPHDDVLAAGLARLLISSDAAPLPVLGDTAAA